MARTLDINKASDCIEWVFLELMMNMLGFGDRWISQVMKCITTVSYLVISNGQPGTVIKFQIGIKQEDLISPYLFIICAKELSALLTEA